MINYRIKDIKFFLKYMKQLGTMVNEAFIHFGNKIRIVGKDPGGISVFEFVFSGESLEIIEDENRKMGIYLSDLEKIFKRFTGTSELSIIVNDNKLTIKGKINNRMKTFNLYEVDVDEKKRIPIENLLKIPYNAIMKIDGGDFLEAVKDGELNSDIVTISADGNILTVSSIGVSGSNSTEMILKSEIYANESSSYSIRFLKSMLDPMKDSEITVFLKSDYPLALFDKISDKSFIRFFLAPRVEDD